MGIGGVTGYVSSLLSLRSAGRRVSVPVRPSHIVFAQYRHVSGIPASGGQKGVPLSRLQIIDSVLSNFQRVTSSQETGSQAIRLHQAVNSSPQYFSSLGSASSAGMILNLIA